MAGAEEDDDSHIIASVRRILGEDASRPREPAAPPADVFELEPGMMIEAGPAAETARPAPAEGSAKMPDEDELSPDLAAWASEWGEEEPEAAAAVAPLPEPAPAIGHPAADTTSGRPAPEPAPPADMPAIATPRLEPTPGVVPEEPILEPRTAEAAGHAFGSLRDTLRAQRATATAPAAMATSSHAGGPTIEELIRQELRPLLKAWLDASLPELVERVVRAEIARIVERAGD